MALYSLSATPVGGAKTEARSCASAFCAYMEREAEYVTKGGKIASFVLLPDNAPSEWEDPHVLWAAVDEIEGLTGHAATEYRGALANELTIDQNIEALLAWLEPHRNAGRCIHAVIHESPVHPGEYHFHALETVRGLKDDGTWKNKRETFYPIRRDGVEITIPASHWKSASKEGWEKIFPFNDGINRTKTEALSEGLSWKEDRKGKKPLQDDVRTNDWGSKSTLYLYRETWAKELNKVLAKYAPEVEPVDHRSYADRNIDKVPQVKMGWHATKAERDEQARCEREGDLYEPVTVNGAKNAEIAVINEKLAEKALPEEAREELLDRGYELRDMSFENAEQVREHTKPLFEYVRQAIVKHVKNIIDRVLELPVVKTFRSFVRESSKRGVEVKKNRSELSYSCAGYGFSSGELGRAYSRDSIVSALTVGWEQARESDMSNESRKRAVAQIESTDHLARFDEMDIDAAIAYAKERTKTRSLEESSWEASKDIALRSRSILDMGRGAEAAVSQNEADARNTNRGSGGPGDGSGPGGR